jgi:hypothetical protein
MGILSSVGGTLIGGGIGFAIGGPAGAAVGASIGSGIDAGRAAERASKAQESGLKAQIAELRRQYDLTREDLAPFRESELAFTKQYEQEVLGTGPSKFTESPGYKFRMGEAEKAVNRAASSQGFLNTPAQQKALYRYSQGIASDEYQKYLTNLRGGTSVSPASTTATATAGQNVATQIGGARADIGSSRAGGIINRQNAYSNAINQLATYGGYRYGMPAAQPATPTTYMA